MLIKPIISEKSLREVALNRFTFRTSLDDTKTTIKKTIQKMYDVQVEAIQTVVVPGKTKRRGKKGLKTSRADWKKAVIELKPNQKNMEAVAQLFETAAREENNGTKAK